MNGVLLVNKPKGITSHDVVAKVRRALSMKAVGHAGTLDPMAQGLLIVLLGEATKFSNYIMGQDKKYSAEVRLGLETDSWDAEGELTLSPEEIKSKKVDLSEDQVLTAVQSLKGPLQFKVPVHSAVKVQGKKLYDYARKGQEVETPTRTMVFYKSELTGSSINSFFLHGEDYITPVLNVDLECEKGAYIRSWVHHLGQNLGCGALMSGLVRHGSGRFRLEDAISYDMLLELDQIRMDIKNKLRAKKEALANDTLVANEMGFIDHVADLESKLETALINIQKEIIDIKSCFDGHFYRVYENEIRLLKNGQIPNDLNLRMRPLLKQCQFENKTELVRIFSSDLNQMIAVLELPSEGKPKIIRAFQD